MLLTKSLCCQDYEDLSEANETETLEEFLKLSSEVSRCSQNKRLTLVVSWWSLGGHMALILTRGVIAMVSLPDCGKPISPTKDQSLPSSDSGQLYVKVYV